MVSGLKMLTWLLYIFREASHCLVCRLPRVGEGSTDSLPLAYCKSHTLKGGSVRPDTVPPYYRGRTSHIIWTANSNRKPCVNSERPVAQEPCRSDASSCQLVMNIPTAGTSAAHLQPGHEKAISSLLHHLALWSDLQ
ncbi:hypothetical protein DPMN_114767 [Dreissena polymorpha]|uniref:Secreted protein n=1 Tax=Dreissena polymorpha TaxID=45954 RepID=A0A9D4KKQ2_DREPO|nr:hypothetical protein DPMN_114767 [Dreissena polymorpha]